MRSSLTLSVPFKYKHRCNYLVNLQKTLSFILQLKIIKWSPYCTLNSNKCVTISLFDTVIYSAAQCIFYNHYILFITYQVNLVNLVVQLGKQKIKEFFFISFFFILCPHGVMLIFQATELWSSEWENKYIFAFI